MRALLSVYDKTGIVDLARALDALGCELVSSGGTARAIADAGIAVTDVAEHTGYPAMLGHRVVTLHPKVHGGILADRDDAEHVADLATYEIPTIDLVVVNLYPFASDPSIELIDIGGPAMVRAAAKNHAHVGVVVDPTDYAPVLAELRASGALSAGLRRSLARTAFAHTAAYDALIVGWFDASTSTTGGLPETIHLSATRAQALRYGENPHQIGARYTFGDSCWDSSIQHQGKEMSYLNVYDADAAWRLVWSLGDDPAAVVVKHANPCGVAVHRDITGAYASAHDSDPVSAFGGIVALNRPMPVALAELLAPVFTEVVIAPSYEPGVLEVLAAKPNLRVIESRRPAVPPLDVRSIEGGLLVQTPDVVSLDRSRWTVATERAPTVDEWRDLDLAWRIAALSVSGRDKSACGRDRATASGSNRRNAVPS